MHSGNLFTRDDTFLGICQGIGEDFGFNPNWLRLAFAVSLLWNPAAVVTAYLALGLPVMASRLIVRDPKPPRSLPAAAEAEAPAADETAQPELPLAA